MSPLSCVVPCRVERVLELAHIALNKNTVPGDKSALVPRCGFRIRARQCAEHQGNVQDPRGSLVMASQPIEEQREIYCFYCVLADSLPCIANGIFPMQCRLIWAL